MGAYEMVLVTVPDLSGLVRSAARQMVAAASLYVCAETEEYDPAVAPDHVVRQTPPAGTKVPRDMPVDLVISRGPQPPAMPDVIGQTQEAATEAITGSGLAVGTVSQEYSLAVPVGSVISQSVAAGAEVPPGTAVDFVVSRGGIAVPDVTGQAQNAASSVITGSGLVVGTVTQQGSATVPVGAVISQSPSAGASVLPGAAVALVISLGAQPCVVPDVVGLPQAQAEAAIAGAGLALGNVTQAYSDTAAAGIVLSQSPAAGAELSPGRVVGIVVSLGSATAEGEGEPAAVTAEQLADVYDAADTNGDGALSFSEAVAAVTGLTQAVFNELDTNGDGQLASDELGVDASAGCTGCQGSKKAFDPTRMGDLFLMALGALGLAAMAPLRRR
jgi:beta-lactam-binding protein with PASTA domain